jgi:hypothetical protein
MQRAEIGRTVVPGQSEQKSLQDPISTSKKLGMWQKARPYLQNNPRKEGWDGGVA